MEWFVRRTLSAAGRGGIAVMRLRWHARPWRGHGRPERPWTLAAGWPVVTLAVLAVGSVFGERCAAETLGAAAARKLVTEATTGPIEVPAGITSLDPEAADILASHPGGLSLPGVKEIRASLATRLAKSRRSLALDGLQAVDEPSAAALATSRAELSFKGLTRLDSQALAQKLASQVTGIALPRITRLERAVADVLSSAQAAPVLEGLQELDSPRLAARLAANGGEALVFQNLTKVSPEVAAALGQHRGILRLAAFKEVPEEVARGLAGHKGTLDLDGVGAILPAALSELLATEGPLDLGGLQSLGNRPGQPVDGSVVEGIQKHVGILTLNGLGELRPEVASAIARREGSLQHRADTFLSSIRTLSSESAAAILNCKSDIWLDGLEPNPSGNDETRALATLLEHKGPGGLILPGTMPQDYRVRAANNRFVFFGNRIGR